MRDWHEDRCLVGQGSQLTGRHSNPHEIANTSSRKFSPKSIWTLRYSVKSLVIQEGLLGWFRHLVRIPSGHLFVEVLQASLIGRRPQERSRTCWVKTGLGMPQNPLVEVAGEGCFDLFVKVGLCNLNLDKKTLMDG